MTRNGIHWINPPSLTTKENIARTFDFRVLLRRSRFRWCLREQKIYHKMLSQPNSSISSWHVCVNVSAPVSNRATERGKVKAPVIKQWDCADDPITLWIQGVEGLWSLTGLSLCYVNVSFYNISLHLHGSADCIVPFSFFFNSCQVTSSNTES